MALGHGPGPWSWAMALEHGPGKWAWLLASRPHGGSPRTDPPLHVQKGVPLKGALPERVGPPFRAGLPQGGDPDMKRQVLETMPPDMLLSLVGQVQYIGRLRALL